MRRRVRWKRAQQVSSGRCNDASGNRMRRVEGYAGAGVGYDFNDHFGLGLSYDYFHANKDHVNLTTDTASLTAEYRF